MTYYEWLMKHRYRDTPTGDLARDAEGDKLFAAAAERSLEDLLSYLLSKSACRQAREVATKSWNCWRRSARGAEE